MQPHYCVMSKQQVKLVAQTNNTPNVLLFHVARVGVQEGVKVCVMHAKFQCQLMVILARRRPQQLGDQARY